MSVTGCGRSGHQDESGARYCPTAPPGWWRQPGAQPPDGLCHTDTDGSILALSGAGAGRSSILRPSRGET